MTVAAVAAWSALILIAYVYVGYPLALTLLAMVRRRPVSQANVTPSVTLLVSAFNEEDVMAQKLRNTLTLDYPKDRLEVIVISDASTDGTDRIVESFAPHGITLLRMPARVGKTVGLNAALVKARGDIVVFSDANIMYQPDTLRCLVRSFADPAVGCVTGDSRYRDDAASAAHVQERTYWGYERYIRSLESRIGNTVGGDGAIFAIRRELYTPLAPEAINDLVIPLQIVTKGYRAVFEPNAVGIEPTTGDFRKEFRRKRRIVNRSWRGVMSVGEVLNPFKVGIFAWQVWSHKILRWLVLPLVVVAAAGCIGAYRHGWVYQAGAWGFLGSLLLAGVGVWAPVSRGPLARAGHLLLYFYLVNLAALIGLIRALSGRIDAVWVPERG